MADYNKIGINYSITRKADIRIFNKIFKLLNNPVYKSITDIGAGTGNYANLLAEKGNNVTALEPSSEMIRQAVIHKNIEWVKGYAEDISLKNNTYDGAICILSIHHFTNLKKSFNEIFRILKPGGILLIFTYIPENQDTFWLQDYFPELFKIDIDKFPGTEKLKKITSDIGFEFSGIVRHELYYNSEDNFLAANWRLPENYLNEDIRKGISTFSLLTEKIVAKGVNLLNDDLKNGEWNRKYGYIKTQEYFDAGYRFLKFTKS